MDIKKLLKVQKNLADKDIQTIFENIAEKLMKKFCLLCDKKKYYFAEIEFYYYDKDRFNDEWNWVTYPRTNKEAGGTRPIRVWKTKK